MRLPSSSTTRTTKPEPSWAAIPEQRREEIMERHQDNERSVSSSLLLCNETIHMIMYVLCNERSVRFIAAHMIY